jgi:hypothetical protein
VASTLGVVAGASVYTARPRARSAASDADRCAHTTLIRVAGWLLNAGRCLLTGEQQLVLGPYYLRRYNQVDAGRCLGFSAGGCLLFFKIKGTQVPNFKLTKPQTAKTIQSAESSLQIEPHTHTNYQGSYNRKRSAKTPTRTRSRA